VTGRETEATLRIALLSPDLPSSPYATGIGTYTALTASALARRGHRVHVLTRAFDAERSERSEDGVVTHWIGPARPSFPGRIDLRAWARLATRGIPGEVRYRLRVGRTLERLVDQGEVDLIETADVLAEGIAYRAQHRPHVPFIVRMHGPLSVGERFDRTIPEAIRRAAQALERHYLLRASHRTAPSSTSASLMRGWMKLGNRSIRSFPNVPPADLPEPTDPDAAARDVLFVGRLVPMKGVDVLVAAAQRVLAQVPDATFTFLGTDHTAEPTARGPAERLLRTTPAELRGRMRFLGKRPLAEVQRRYGEAAVVALPSRFDNFPYTCLEAMAAGAPIVGTPNGGMNELLDGGRAGRLVPPDDPVALADALVDLLTHPDRRAALGAAARARVTDRYDRERIVDETEAFYREALRDAR
jgi:glycosyltransferase involved in cell wall biosynthesis